MDPVELSLQLQKIVAALQSFNKNIHIIFTISPVRHLREGLIENNRSKSVLIYAVHDVIAKLKGVDYFPAYEYVIDDLRDYRFYAEDMLHPNQTAIEYIWIQFFENYISESEFGLMNEICEVQRALQHRPFNQNTESHLKFLENLNLKIDKIKEKLPEVAFS